MAHATQTGAPVSPLDTFTVLYLDLHPYFFVRLQCDVRTVGSDVGHYLNINNLLQSRYKILKVFKKKPIRQERKNQ